MLTVAETGGQALTPCGKQAVDEWFLLLPFAIQDSGETRRRLRVHMERRYPEYSFTVAVSPWRADEIQVIPVDPDEAQRAA